MRGSRCSIGGCCVVDVVCRGKTARLLEGCSGMVGGWFVAKKCEEETKKKRPRKVEEYVRGHAAAAGWFG